MFSACLRTCSTTSEPSTPALAAIWRSGLLERAAHDVDADCVVALELQLVEHLRGAEQGDAATGTMPSSTAARVAARASSTRAFFSFISISVAAPTLMTATPPASLARRSWSFSLS